MFSVVYKDLLNDYLMYLLPLEWAISIDIHHGSPYIEIAILRKHVSTVALNGQTHLSVITMVFFNKEAR